MWPNLQKTVDLVTFTEEIPNENFIFCAVLWIPLNIRTLPVRRGRTKDLCTFSVKNDKPFVDSSTPQLLETR